LKQLPWVYHANAAIAVALHVMLSGVLLVFLLQAEQATNAAAALLLKVVAALLYLGVTAAGVWLWRRGSAVILLLAPVSVALQVIVIWIGNDALSWAIPYGG
jgi:hypothetical protein